MSRIFIGDVLAFSFSFLYRNINAIVIRTILPTIVGWGVFYLSLSLYLTELAKYLEHPSDRVGSLVLGLATAGLLITLFLHTLIVSSITALALGKEDGGWKYIHAARREWRLYAANLRLLVLFVVWIAAIRLLTKILTSEFSASAHFITFMNFLTVAGLVWICARFYFLLAPISVGIPDGPILRRSWQLSGKHFWQISAVLLALLAMGLILEIIGEKIFHAVGILPHLPGLNSLAGYVILYRRMLPAILIVVGFAYLISNVVLTVARAYVYKHLSNRA